MRKFALIATCLLAATAAVAESRGVRPRPSRTSYPVACFTENVAVAAALLPPDQVRSAFGPEIEKRFLVVEVGVFPKTGRVDVKLNDFALRFVAPQRTVKPVDGLSISEAGGSRALDKLLPEFGTLKPVGGYLFFSLPEPPVYTAYELDYTGHGAWLTLPLTPKRR
jgi:hypothetical protein